MEEVITRQPDLGPRVVALDYDHHVAAMATADLLASRGVEVDLVTACHMVGAEVEINTQTVYFRRLAEHGVRIHPNLVAVEIEAGRVRFQNRFSGRPSEIAEVDAVVICSPGAAEAGLASALRPRVREVCVVGDAYAPRRLLAGIHDAYQAARAL